MSENIAQERTVAVVACPRERMRLMCHALCEGTAVVAAFVETGQLLVFRGVRIGACFVVSLESGEVSVPQLLYGDLTAERLEKVFFGLCGALRDLTVRTAA